MHAMMGAGVVPLVLSLKLKEEEGIPPKLCPTLKFSSEPPSRQKKIKNRMTRRANVTPIE
jgi:hypothetical protein